MMNKYFGMGLALAAIATLAACNPAPQQTSGAQKETQQTNRLLDEAAVRVGIPGITNFTEKRLMKMLYELRDQSSLTTYTYFVDMYGNWHKVCPTTSVGYGMPFSAQFTAPTVDRSYGGTGGYTTLSKHQPEPNGLYMPDSTTATWVICLGPDGKELQPAYVEPQIIVMQTPKEGVE